MADSDREAGTTLAKELGALFVAVAVTADDVQALYRAAAGHHGEVNVLLSNAGISHVPMERFGEPEEIAAAAFLASDDASFITASTFLVDGGIHAAHTTPL